MQADRFDVPSLKSTTAPWLTAAAVLAGALLTAPAWGQQTVTGLPRVSPPAKVSQGIGMTEVEVAYHRPGARNREVWGTLVPYGQVWRAGANENTTVTFSHDVKIEGQDLAAGIYGFHVEPQASGPWTAIFSHDHRAWGSFAYDAAHDALRVKVDARDAGEQEQLAYRFDDGTPSGATLVLHWAGKEVPIRIEVDTHRQVIDDFKAQLTGLPSFAWQGWDSAASYCVRSGVFFEECRQWADRSLAMSRQAQNLMTHAGLLALEGKTDQIAAVEDEALGMANEQQVNAMGYTYLFQRGDAAKAVELFRRNVKDHPDSWNAHDSLGEGLAALGNNAEAIQLYEKALSMAPDGQKGRIESVLKGLRESK